MPQREGIARPLSHGCHSGRMNSVRQPAVAGMFYPADPGELRAQVDQLLTQHPQATVPNLRALIAPHAGYRFSGAIAASGYNCIPVTGPLRVLLLGPTHRVAIRGVADPAVTAFATSLGEVPLDAEMMVAVRKLPAVLPAPQVHAQEHSLEVHLPFLQRLAARAEVPLTVAPLAVSEVTPALAAEVIHRALAAVPDALVLVSSDLSHYLDYAQARLRDAQTIERMLRCEAQLAPGDACGVRPVNGLLHHAAAAGWQAELVAAANSGDTPYGDHDRVVGYASLAFTAPRPDSMTPQGGAE